MAARSGKWYILVRSGTRYMVVRSGGSAAEAWCIGADSSSTPMDGIRYPLDNQSVVGGIRLPTERGCKVDDLRLPVNRRHVNNCRSVVEVTIELLNQQLYYTPFLSNVAVQGLTSSADPGIAV